MPSALSQFFTNEVASKEHKTPVEAPAFSLTKVQSSLATLIAAISGAVPASLHAPVAVKVAAIGAGALVMVGVFGLAAVDLIARQRAAEAKLRWGDGESGTGGGGGGGSSANSVVLVAKDDDLVLQKKHTAEEFEIRYAELEGTKLTLIARRGGETLAASFQPPT